MREIEEATPDPIYPLFGIITSFSLRQSIGKFTTANNISLFPDVSLELYPSFLMTFCTGLATQFPTVLCKEQLYCWRVKYCNG